MVSEYVCEVLPLKKRDCANGYTHRASLYATDGKGRYLRNHARGRSAENARILLEAHVSVSTMQYDAKKQALDAIDAAGKELATV